MALLASARWKMMKRIHDIETNKNRQSGSWNCASLVAKDEKKKMERKRGTEKKEKKKKEKTVCSDSNEKEKRVAFKLLSPEP